MRIRVKICGVTDLEGVEAAAACGADAVGFVFADSPRRVAPGMARRLAEAVPPFVARVAVLHRPSAGELARVLEEFDPDVVQVELARELPLLARCRALLPVLHDGAVERELELVHETGSRALLFEAAGRGGRGAMPDHDRAQRLAREFRLVLAGGLRASNVAAAIRRVRPYAVDVSSGVERAPGVKDPRAIAEFVAAVREAERELAQAGR